MISDKRLPMIIVEKRNPYLENRNILNAKSAAIHGFSIFGKNHFYILNDQNQIDVKGLTNFMKNYEKRNF